MKYWNAGVNRLEFEDLCRSASLELGIEDAAALGQGFSVPYAGVLYETAFREGRDRFVLMAEMGCVQSPHKQDVYENLLAMQAMTWNQSSVKFGFNPARQSTVLCIEAAVPAGSGGRWLAHLIRSSASQVAHWRETLLQGKPL